MPRNEAPRPVLEPVVVAVNHAIAIVEARGLSPEALTAEDRALLFSSAMVNSGLPLDTRRQTTHAERLVGLALGNHLMGNVMVKRQDGTGQ